VRAVERALDILLCFTAEHPDLSLTQIAERVGIHKSTAHRLLATLESRRFVSRYPSNGTYHLGLRFIEMASVVLEASDLRRWARPYLERLAAESGETVDLAVLDGTSVVYLDVVQSPQPVKIAAQVGRRLPVTCTATGKAFLAHMPESEVRVLLEAGLPKYTDLTMLSPEELLEDLAQTRQRGFAISVQEFEKDINAVAAPLLDAGQSPVAAVAIVGPSYRLAEQRMLDLGQLVCQTTQAMVRESGKQVLTKIASGTLTPDEPRRGSKEG
jgi:DNA-binding IclR family transcriptional regulator